MWIDAPVPDAETLDSMLEAYFDGLLARVSSASGRDLGGDAADVKVLSAGDGRFEAEIHLIDVFDSYEPVDLHVHGASERSNETVLRFRISPQPQSHSVWSSLAVASESLEKP